MTTSSMAPAPVRMTPDRRGGGWVALIVGLLTIAVGVSWLPGLLGPLGDNHEGRIYGMVSLQASNLWDLGWSASQWGTSRAPFAEAYSHHPPGFSLWYLPAWQLPGDPTSWIRVLPYLLGLSFLPASAALLHRLRMRPVAIVTAVGLVAATPLFWVYGRIWPALGLVALLALAIADLRERDRVTTGRLVAVCALAAFAILANWFAMAAAGLLGLWLLAGRGLDRVTVVVGATMAVAAGGTVAWVVFAPDTVEAAQQFAVRTTGGGFTTAEFVDRIGRWLTELLPWWMLLAVPGVLVGLWDRRTRWLMAGAVALGVGWVVAFPNGAWVHDYWIGSLLVPAVLAIAVLVDRVAGRWSRVALPIGVVAVAGAIAVVMVGDVPEAYVDAPQDAGELVTSVEPPDQDQAWVTRGIPGPTWLGHAWDMPAELVMTRADLADVPDDEVVLVDLDRAPRWIQDVEALRSAAIAAEGGYVLVTGSDLQAASRPRG